MAVTVIKGNLNNDEWLDDDLGIDEPQVIGSEANSDLSLFWAIVKLDGIRDSDEEEYGEVMSY